MYKMLILPTVGALSGTLIYCNTNLSLLSLPSETSVHFNLITINAVFAGFLYTNFSLLVGISDRQIIRRLEKTSLIAKRNQHIMFGIVCSIISVVAGLFLTLEASDLWEKIVTQYISWAPSLVYNIELSFMAFSVLAFALSIREMSIIIKHIKKPEKNLTTEDIDIIKKQLKDSRK